MRVKGLDVLRGIAILLVLGSHQYIDRTWERAGWSGVTLFFVLSGFLVSGLLFKEYKLRGEIKIGRFLARRGARIYPPFYAMLFSTLFIVCLTNLRMPEPKWIGGDPLPTSNLLSEIFFVQNYHPGLWGQCWSLGVEEHFYLLLALSFFLLFRRSKVGTFDRLPRMLVSLSVVVLGMRCLTAFLVWPFSYYIHYAPTHLRIDAMMLGVLISYYYHFKRERYAAIAKQKSLLVLGAVIGLAPIVLWSGQEKLNYTLGFTTAAIGFGCVLILALAETKGKFGPVSIAGSIFAYVGRYSYSIYLWHRVVNEWALAELETRYGKLDYRIEFILFLLGAIALGVITQELIDVPCLKLRNILFPSRSGEPVVSYQPERSELAA